MKGHIYMFSLIWGIENIKADRKKKWCLQQLEIQK